MINLLTHYLNVTNNTLKHLAAYLYITAQGRQKTLLYLITSLIVNHQHSYSIKNIDFKIRHHPSSPL